MVDIDALKTKFVKIPEQYGLKHFLGNAVISKNEYSVISRLLEKNKNNIKLNLTKEDISSLENQFAGTRVLGKDVLVSDFLKNYSESDWSKIEYILKSKKSVNYKMLSNWRYIRDILENVKPLIFKVTDEECANTISDFIDSVSSIPNDEERDQQLQYIDSLLEVIISGGNIGKDFDAKFNHDRIPRYIARYHFEYTTSKFWEDRSCVRDDVRQSLYQENTEFYVINDYIHTMLNGSEGDHSQWWRMWWFLEILRVLRNYVDHYQPYITTDDERLTTACFILYTFVGTFYAMKQNLISCQALKDKNPWTTTRKKTLRVFYRDQISKEVSENDRAGVEEILPKIKLFVKVEESTLIGNKIEGCMEFTLVKGKEYLLKCGDNKPVDVPSDKIWSSPGNRPLFVWNGVRSYFFRDLSTVNAELKPYIEAAHEAAISRNAEAIEKLSETITELNGIVNALRGKLDETLGVIKALEDDIKNLTKVYEGIILELKNIQDKQDELNTNVKKGFGRAHIDAEEQKGLLKRIIEALERKEQKNSGIVNKTAVIVIIIAIIAGISYKVWPKDKPEVLITKGDHYLRNGDAEKAGETYRKAIKAYEDILSEDSVDVDANLGLAMMLMRGKGIYDLAEAEHCAKRASEESTRAEGLYHYLLFLNKKYGDVDHLVGNLRADGEKDEYTILTDALLEIYGCCDRERSLESVLRARTVLDSLCKFNQDAVLDRAGIVKYGIEREKCEDDFYIWPDPIFAESDLSVIANDSLNPVAMAMLSEFYGQLGEMKDCLEWGVSAYECGMKAYAPSLTIQMLQNNIIENPGIDFKAIFKELERSARHDKSLTGECAKYMTRVHNYSINEMPAKDLLKSTDVFIDILKLTQDGNYAQFLEQLYRFRVTLCLEVGDLPRATSLAMKVDVFNDSIAVSQYLEGICCDRGWAGQPQDSILRDNLINSSAERGYPEAVYTRLKKAEPLRCYPIRINRKDPVYKFTTAERVFASDIYRKFGNKGVFRNSFYRNGKQSAKPIFDLTFITPVTNSIKPESLPKEEIVEASSQTSPFVMGEAEVELKDDFDYKDFQYVVGIHYDASIYAQISDSIWSKSPKLAVELADYWRDYYSPGPYYLPIQEQDSPYVEYCPKEYQVIWDVLARCYNYVELSNGNDGLVTVDLINKPIMEDYFAEIKIGIASAMKHGNSEMAKHLITMWLTLSNNNEVDEAEKVRYEKFALPEYKNKGFQPYKKIDYPIYAY